MKQRKNLLPTLLLFALALLLSACGPTVTQTQAQQIPTVNPSFQTQLTPIPTIPPYRCGAWASNNAPNGYSTITIFARLTKNVAGVAGATAQAVVHFTNSGDTTLDTTPVSDNGGYVSFLLPLAGRQPTKIPTTVSITFSVPGVQKSINCSPAFFTPQ